ncbi:MAG: FkbM family methyltransferase [Pseudomonadota bacterium]
MLAFTDLGIPKGNLGYQLAKWTFASNEQTVCKRFESANRFYWRMPITLSRDNATGLYLVQDQRTAGGENSSPDCIFIARPERVFRYRRGVAHRVAKLARKYFIDRIPLKNGDVVIDCGANVGEIGLYIRSRTDTRLIAVEPSEPEAKACDANLFDNRAGAHRYALWNSSGMETFFDSNVTGDSSLISPASPHAGVTKVATKRIDELVEELEIDRIKILKIEGEGAEPEILAGSQGIISKVSHCVVDSGPERGAEKRHVIPEVCNFLFGAGFELRDVNLERQIYWFYNRKNYVI